MKLLHTLIAIVVTACLAGNSSACSSDADDCVEVGKWALSLGVGAGVRTNPLADGDHIPLILIPQLSYTGERFFIQNMDVGVVLWESEQQQLNLLATPSYDQVFFHRWSPSNFFLDGNRFAAMGGNDSEKLPIVDSGDKEFIEPSFRDVETQPLRNRRMAGLAGFEYSFINDVVDVQLQYVTDFTKIHAGDEVRISLAKHWAQGRHHVTAAVGAVWQSSEVINYYYGLTLAEADSAHLYSTGAALSTLARIDWNYQLTKRWNLRLLTSYRHLPTEISASPLINDNKVITVFIGGVYHF